jgi:hypothetical protein
MHFTIQDTNRLSEGDGGGGRNDPNNVCTDEQMNKILKKKIDC